MNRVAFAISGCLVGVTLASVSAAQTALSSQPLAPANYVYFGRDRERIRDSAFLSSPRIVGAQLRYSWRELEPERDRYDLRELVADLTYLEQHGKRLFVQLQDVSFGEQVLVPEYLVRDSAFHGGVARKLESDADDDSKVRFDGMVARRWDPAVRERFARLLQALGRAVDGRIEGINLPETATSFGATGQFFPTGFSYVAYVDAVKANLSAARAAFPRSVVMQYANFMPGEWLPGDDRGYLRTVYAHAEQIGAAVGGPDLLPHRAGQRNHSLALIAARASGVRAGLAVQDGNLAAINPASGAPVTVRELYDYARDRLHLDYLFWGIEEPYYTRDVLPFLRSLP